MSLTTKDILEKTFKRSFKGYDEDEVDKFLDEIIDELKLLKKENEALKKEIGAVKELESNIKETEETIMNTLVSAQKSSERILREAARKAELLIDNAENTARQKEEQTKRDLVDMERKLAAIKQSAGNFAMSFSEMINAQAISFEKTYQSYFGDMDAYSSSGINTEALEKLDKTISEDIEEIVGKRSKNKEKEEAETEETVVEAEQKLEVEWSLPVEDGQAEQIAQSEPEALAETAIDEVEAQDSEEVLEASVEEETLEYSLVEEEPQEEMTTAMPDDSETPDIAPSDEYEEPQVSEVVKSEPAVPLEPVKDPLDEEKAMPLNEINKVLAEMDDDDIEPSDGNPKYDDYSWLYGDDNKKVSSEFELSFKDPKESEELKNLIDDVIE